MICTPPPADSGCPMSGYTRLRDLWVNPPPSPPKKPHPLQCFLNQTAADPRRVMSHPRGRGTGAAGSRAGSDAMTLGRAPNTHVNTVHVPPCVSTSQIPPPSRCISALARLCFLAHRLEPDVSCFLRALHTLGMRTTARIPSILCRLARPSTTPLRTE